MNAAHHRSATARNPARPADETAEPETVYLRTCPDGRWSVHLGPSLILLTEAEEKAFQTACAVAWRDGHPSRPMLLLSGPKALQAGSANHEA